MKYFCICFLGFILIAICSKSFAQSFLIKKLDIKGMPAEINFSSIQQDDDGFIWLGGLSGLFRYDGSRVMRFLRDPSDSNSLTHNYANTLCKDLKGNIWIGTFGGFMNKYDRNSGKIRRIEPGNKSLSRLVVMKTKMALDGNVIAATAQCFYKINESASVIDSIIISQSLPDKTKIRITDFMEYEKDHFLVTSTSGIFILEWKKRSMYGLKIPSAGEINFTCIEKDAAGNFWLGSNKGLFILNPDLSLKDQHSLPNHPLLDNGNVNAIKKDSRNAMWVGASTGLYIVKDALIQKIDTRPGDSIRGISRLFIDSKGTAWVTTSFNSLYLVYQPGIVFKSIPGMQLHTQNKQTQSILEEKPGTWLIGSMLGLYRYHFATEKFEEIYLPGSKNKKWIGCQLLDKNNGHWVGTFGDGVFYRPPGKAEFLHFKNDPKIDSSFPFNTIIAMAEDSSGNIWMGSYSNGGKNNALCYYDPRTKKIHQISGNTHDPKTFNAGDISQIETDDKHHLWIGTWGNGLHQHNGTGITPQQNIFTNYSETSAGSHRISNNIVSCARPGKNGKIYFGTISGGMNILDTKTDSVTWFTIRNGLPSNLIYRIEEDDGGIVWMSTDNGIARFDPTSKSTINYGTNSGLPANNFTFLTSVKCKDGTIAFGTDDGQVVHFNPNSYKNLVNTQPVIITDIRLFNKSLETGSASLLKKNAYLTDTLQLKYDHSVISFELSNMDFLNPEVYTYAYKLQGFDKDWTFITDRNSITYTNLDPGNYTLLVKNANHLGTWNETPTKLFIIINPPYWRTWWFISLMVLAVAALIYSLFRYRLQQQLRVLQVRNRLHRDLHDDIGATLSSVKAYSEILTENPDNPVIAELIKDNSTDMLERLEVIAWATNPQHDNFKSLKNIMIKFATPLCHSKNIQFHLDSAINEEIMIPGEVRQNIFLVFKEAINNVIKYAAAKECNAQLFVQNNQFKLQITDNGKGFDGTIQGTGNGWKNMRKRTEGINGNLTIDSKPGKGTSIVMQVPYPFKIPSSWDIKQPQD